MTGTTPPSSSLRQGWGAVGEGGTGAHVHERQEHLGGDQLALAQQLVVGAVELALTDGACGLQLLYGARSRGQAHDAHPARDRTRGDDHNLLAVAVQSGNLVANTRKHIPAQLALLVGDDARTQLYDHTLHSRA